MQRQTKVAQKWIHAEGGTWKRGGHISVALKTQEGRHDQHLPDRHFKDKTRKEGPWDRFSNSRNLSVKVCKIWFDSQRTRFGKLTQSKSGQVPAEMTERQKWIQDKFHFLKSHIRRNELSKSSGFKPQARGPSASAASAHDIARASTDSLEISMRSDTTIQPSVTSPSTVSACSSVDQQVMEQFTLMRNMLSSFLGQKQETRTALCNYLASERALDFQTFRNEAVKLLSIQSRAEERGHQPRQQTLSPSSNATSTFVPQTFQQPQQSALAARNTIPETQMPASQVIQPLSRAKWQPKDSSSKPEGSRFPS